MGVSEFSQTPLKGTEHLSGMFKIGAAAGVENKDNFPGFSFLKSHSASS